MRNPESESRSQAQVPQRPEPEIPHYAKRRKISIACNDCRLRKIRCDGVRPVCGPCFKRHGLEAACTLRVTAQEEFSLLREEIAHLCDKVNVLEGQSKHSPANRSTSKDQDLADTSPRDVDASHTDRNSRPNQHNSLVSQGSSGSTSMFSSEEEVDPMVGIANRPAPNDQPFFGTSSASEFVRQVQNALDLTLTWSSPASLNASRLGVPRTSDAASSMKCKPGTIELPPRATADHLLNIYWRITHSLYPFLDQDDTEEKYSQLWLDKPHITIQRSFVCQINMIFAMASQLDETVEPSTRGALAQVYVDRAKQLFTSELWEQASLQAVQNFLILGQYLHSTPKGYQCWMIIGHAVRMAQNLGLHIRETSERMQSHRKRQLLRKVWHGCIMMDRIVALTFGRPTMIDGRAAALVPMPIPVDDKYISHDPSNADETIAHQPMEIQFYIESLKLYEILNDILTILYTSTGSANEGARFSLCSDAEKLAPLLHLDQSLTLWLENLPSHLREGHEQASNQPFVRQANILSSRYLHVRILLFRPSLARFTTLQKSLQSNNHLSTTLCGNLLLRCSISCVQTAVNAIQTIEKHMPESVAAVGLLPARWYNILYVYTAGIVLLSATQCSTIQAEVGLELIIERFGTAISIVRRYRVYSPSVERSLEVLEALFMHTVKQVATAPADNLPPPAVPQHDRSEWIMTPHFSRFFGQLSHVDPGSLVYDPMMATNYQTTFPYQSLSDISSATETFNFTYNAHDPLWLNSLPFNL